VSPAPRGISAARAKCFELIRMIETEVA